MATGGPRQAVERMVRAAARVLRHPGRVVSFLAYPIQTVRILRSPNLQRGEYLSNPSLQRVARKPWRFFVPAGLTVVLLAVLVPIARLVLLVVVAVGALAVAWHRWTNSSWQLRRRGLPPGEPGIPLFTAWVDDGFYRRQWERYGPIYTVKIVHPPTVAVGGIERARRILREHRDDLLVPVFSHAERVEGGAVRNQVGDRHRTSRAVFTRAFGPNVVEAARPAMHAAVRRHLAGWLAEGAETGPPGSPMRSRVKQLVLDAWITVFLGVDPRTDVALHSRLVELFGRYNYLFPDRREPDDLAEQLAIIRERSLHPDELSPSALRTLAEHAPEALDDPVVTSNLVHMLDSSRHDVGGLLDWLVYRLAHHPEWCDRIREAGADDEPASWVVSETLRLNQSENLYRETQCPVTIDRYKIPAGWWLRVLVRESHRDPEVFADPGRFDPCRFARGMPPRSQYSPFGLDGHACIGESLARTFAIVVARELSVGCGLEPTADGPPMVSGWHWAPSSEFRVRITAADPASSSSTA